MRSVIEIFWHIILALLGALGFGALILAGVALACGCGVLGTTWCWRRWRARWPR